MPCGSNKDQNNQEKSTENKHCAFEDLDHSLLQHPLNLGVTNVKQILKCIQNASKEVKDILLNECNIIYECKVCASLFRSLANFLYHKRCYCKKHLCEEMLLFENFEEDSQVTIVEPEPNQITQLVDCSVNLIQTDLVSEKGISKVESFVSKAKFLRGKGNKTKEQVDNDKTKTVIQVQAASPMISRRTREKRSMNITKRTEELAEQEQPQKTSKSVGKGNSRLSTESKMSIDNDLEKEVESNEDQVDTHKKDSSSKEQMKACPVAGTIFKTEAQMESLDLPKKEREMMETSDLPVEETIVELSDVPREVIEKEQMETDKNGEDAIYHEEIKNPVEASDISVEVTDIHNVINLATAKSEVKEISQKLSKQMQANAKPLKKMILKKQKSVHLKNVNMFDNIPKNLKYNKIGLSNIANADGKNLQCLPKVVFKAIDGNPHAVFQSTADALSPKVILKSKRSCSVVQSSRDKEKGLFVLKKDSSNVTEVVSRSIKEAKPSKTQNEFHLTRRKKLLGRSDCSVHKLRCLTCKSQFTSLKTLYFHMLSLHSKKRQYFPCPFCKAFFVQVYGVNRHLLAFHHKTKEQVNKLRSLIKKKSFWKKVDENKEEKPKENKSEIKEKEQPKESKVDIKEKEQPKESTVNIKEKEQPKVREQAKFKEQTEPQCKTESETTKKAVKLTIPDRPGMKFPTGKDLVLHKCSKCGRVFGRKSSQVSHEKFCIMNAIKVENSDNASTEINPPPNMSFFALSPTKVVPEESQYQIPSDLRVSSRPKRGAEKQMHKDFVNSQTLKWRSANRVDTNAKPVPVPKKKMTKSLEKKVMNIMSVENLLCTKCDKTFSSFSNLRRHVAIHVGWTRFKCKHCEYQAYNKSQCWAHVQKTHSVSEEELEKSVVNLGNKSGKKKLAIPIAADTQPMKSPEIKLKDPTSKLNGVKVKVGPKKKTFIRDSKFGVEKKPSYVLKKNSSLKKDYTKTDKSYSPSIPTKKEVALEKRERSQSLDKNIDCIKKDKIQTVEIKKDNQPTKLEKSHSVMSVKEKSINLKLVDSPSEVKEKKTFGSIFKLGVRDPKKLGSSYNSVTTNSPTTIILSKKCPISSVQSIVTQISEPSPTSSNKTFPLRSSPRKSDARLSACTTKGSLLSIKMPFQSSSSSENLKDTASPDKSFEKKDKLISEWFPKKDLNPASSRRESAPLIIGLVPATETGVTTPRLKNPAISYERHNS